MRFIGLKSCGTCKNALKTLALNGLLPNIVDVRADGVTRDDLTRFVQTFGASAVNRRSTTWRGLTEGDRARDPIDLLARYPTLMKRPVIEMDDGTLHLGWSDEVLGAVLKTS